MKLPLSTALAIVLILLTLGLCKVEASLVTSNIIISLAFYLIPFVVLSIVNTAMSRRSVLVLGVILMAAVLGVSVVGTLIPQRAPDGYYLEHYGRILAAFFLWLGLPDVFHAWLFKGLLVALGSNLLGCTVKSVRPSFRQVGFYMIHFSLLLIVLGAVIFAQWGVSGLMKISKGELKDTFDAFSGEMTLPFDVHLKDFAVTWYPIPEKIVAFDNAGKSRLIVDPKPGTEHSISGTQQSLRILRALRRPRFEVSLDTLSDKGENPTLIIKVENGHDVVLLAGDPRKSWWMTSDMSLYADFSIYENDSSSVQMKEPSPDKKYLLVEMAEGTSQQLSIDQRNAVFVAGQKYDIDVLDYYSNFRMGDGGAMSVGEEPRNPAVRIRIVGGELDKIKYLFADMPDFQANEELPFKITFVYPRYTRATECVRFHYQEETGQLVCSTRNADYEVITPPHTISLASGKTIEIKDFSPNAEVVMDYVEDASMPRRPAAFVELVKNNEMISGWIFLDGHEHLGTPDHELHIGYRSGKRSPSQYVSTVEIIEDREIVRLAEIEVNKPLRYKGYWLYQSTYDAKGERWSGLEVSRDPGLTLVYIGFVALMVGVCFVFYVKPLLKRKGVQ